VKAARTRASRALSRCAVTGAIGVAVAVAVLAACPRAARADDDGDAWLGPDKAEHFGVSAAIGAGSYALVRPIAFEPPKARLFAFGVAVGVGAAKEGWDALGHGDPSWKDLGWDAAGALVGVAVAWAIDALVSGGRGAYGGYAGYAGYAIR
jgi:putative lipoprotein